MTAKKIIICPYCGDTQPQAERCRACGGLFEPLSRQATHNAMGPWFIRDPARPVRPGCSYETLAKMIDRGQVTGHTILRGPTTRQFWTVARHVPGVSHLLGYCHNCDAHVAATDHGCHACGVPFGAYLDRDNMGLPEVRPLPWEAGLDEAGPRGQEEAAAPAGDRISRFASNDELLGRLPGSGPRREAAGLSGPVLVAGSAADQAASEVLARALRHRVTAQRRTIQIMAMLLVAGAAGIVLLSLGRFGAASPRTAASPAAQPGSAPAETARQPALAAPAEPLEPAAPPSQAQPEQTSAAPGDSLDGIPLDAILLDPRQSAALDLVAAAAREDRSLDERIADYEQALEGLGTIEAGAAGSSQDLAEIIARVKHELERLRLKRDFFGQ